MPPSSACMFLTIRATDHLQIRSDLGSMTVCSNTPSRMGHKGKGSQLTGPIGEGNEARARARAAGPGPGLGLGLGLGPGAARGAPAPGQRAGLGLGRGSTAPVVTGPSQPQHQALRGLGNIGSLCEQQQQQPLKRSTQRSCY
jgi:hypothetical protein